MNIRTSAIRRLAILSLSALAFAACEDKTTSVIPRAEVEVTITPSSAALTVGQTATFVAQVANDTTGTLAGVTYTSSNPAVATVNGATGVVAAVAPGTTTIIATSKFKPTKQAAAIVTVTGTGPTIVTFTLAPATATVATGGTVNLVSVVTGSTNTAVTYVSSDTSVAKVSTAGVVTATQKAGTAVITATPAADVSLAKTAVITVVASAPTTPPSLSISSVTTPTGVPIAPGQTVAGTIIVNMNLTVGTASSIQRIAVRLGGVEACSQTFNPPLAPTQNTALITCVVNTAQLNPTTGAPIFPNGTYELTAVAFSTSSSTAPVATATYGNIVLANVNGVSGTVTFDNTLADQDNIATATPQVDAAGRNWNGGAATVTVRPAIFSGNSAATVDISVDVSCDGVFEATRTATITNGAGSVTFPEAGTTAQIDGVENQFVCFQVNNARAADNSLVNFPINTGTGAVRTAGSTNAFTTSDSMRIDNVEPAAFTQVQPGATTTNYIGSNVNFTVANNVTGGAPSITDGGVGRVTVDFYAIPTSTLAAGSTAAQARTAVLAQTAPTTSSNQLASTITNTSYTLVARAVDALGNVRYVQGPAFGVDRENPTVTRTAQPADSINPPGTDVFTYTVSDTLSGFGNLNLFVYRVNDANPTGVCVDFNAPATATVCDPFVTSATGTASVSVATIDGVVTDGYFFVRGTGSDIAGNVVTGTDSKIILLDTAVPTQSGVVVPITAQTGGANTTISASVADNVDLRAAVPQQTFGLAGTIPTAANTDISTFGLPLVTSTAVSSTSPFIRSLNGVAATAAGFNIEDAAFNASGPSTVAFQAGVVDNTVAGFGAQPAGTGTFVLSSSAADIDRTPGTTGTNIPTSSATLTAVVTGNSGTLNYNIPFNRVMFTFTDRAGIERVLSTTSAPSAGVAADNVNRTFTYTATLSATALKDVLATTGGAPGGTTNVRAIAVDAEGDALTSNTVPINVRN